MVNKYIIRENLKYLKTLPQTEIIEQRIKELEHVLNDTNT